MNHRLRASVKLITSMLIFGSIGLFVRYISFPSSVVAFARALIGVVFWVAVMATKHTTLVYSSIKRNLFILCLSGAAIGFNWILLFESYRYTSVALSTLCYYMAPIIVTLLAPIVLKEKLSLRRFLCVVIALIGIALICGVSESGKLNLRQLKGIAFGLGAAALYATAILLNKHLQQINATDRTICQLSVSAIVLLVYNLFTCEIAALKPSPSALFLLVVVGILHTGIAYYLYFGSMEHLSSQSVAILSYVDPLVAVLVSTALLKEPFDTYTVIGAVAILGAAVASELPHRERNTNDN